MKLLYYPHPALFTKCEEVTVFDIELKKTLKNMHDTMLKHKGVGLSANQVGILKRIFVMKDEDGSPLFLINPKITHKSIAPANLKEGCLSSPSTFLVLPERASWVKVVFQDEHGEKKQRVFNGIYAVAIQHETDHLLGISYLQSKSIPRNKRKELYKKWGLK